MLFRSIINLYSPFANPLISNWPLSPVMVNVTSEESFLSSIVTVAPTTGSLLMVSKAIPFTEPFFWANKTVVKQADNKRKKIFLIADSFRLRKYSQLLALRVIGLGLMLMKVKEY